MAVTCLVHPQKDLTPEQCKELGNSIYKWLYSEPASRSVLPPGMDDLRSGELPQPYYIQRLVGIEGRGLTDELRAEFGDRVKALPREERDRLRKKWGMSRHVELTVNDPAALDRKGIVASLRWDISTELVEDIVIDGVSWNKTFDFDLNLYRCDALMCHIVPRADCSPEEFTCLGLALHEWWKRLRINPRHCRLFDQGITDLLSGSMPRPIRLQVGESAQAEFIEEYGADETEKRAVFVLLRKTIFVASSVFESAQRELPGDLIENVLIDGVGWKR